MRPDELNPEPTSEQPVVMGKRLVSQLQRLILLARDTIKRSRNLLLELDGKPPRENGP
jgi:hypothetical protein